MSGPITNLLKMLFSGGLTRTGVDYGGAAQPDPASQPGAISEDWDHHKGGQPSGSNQRVFKDPSEAGVALAQAMNSDANCPGSHPQTGGCFRVSADDTDQLSAAMISATAPTGSIGAPPTFNERLISTATPPIPINSANARRRVSL